MATTYAMARPNGHLRNFLASEIRAAMGRNSLSGVRLAAIIGKSQPYVSRRLSGKLAFDIDDLEVISRVLGMSPSELISDAVERLRRATDAASVTSATPNAVRVQSSRRELASVTSFLQVTGSSAPPPSATARPSRVHSGGEYANAA